jgi:hypothetical protein
MLPFVARDGDDFHAGHHRAGGIRAVRGDRDQANVAMRLAARFVIAADDQQARRIRPANRRSAAATPGEAGDLRQPRLELLEKIW